MPRLLLHVGLPKTGTTTLQSQLYWREEQGGVHYCHFFKKPSVQSRCFANTVGLGRDAIWDRGADVYKNRSVPNYVDNVKRAVDTGAHTLIVSDETLSRVDYVRAPRLRRLLDELDEICQIEIVLGLRPWFSWLESLINQAVKNGVFDFVDFDADNLVEVNKYAINLSKTYAFYRYGGQFNPGRKDYPVHLLYQTGNMLKDFEALVGERLFEPEEVKTQNKSPTVMQSVRRYFETKCFHVDLIEGKQFSTFLSKDQAQRLYQDNRHWMELFDQFTGAKGYIDDFERFISTADETGAISYVRGLVME